MVPVVPESTVVASLNQVQAVLVANQAQRGSPLHWSRPERTSPHANGTLDHVLVRSPTCQPCWSNCHECREWQPELAEMSAGGSQCHLDILTSVLAEWFPNRRSELVLQAKMALTRAFRRRESEAAVSLRR
jgi:hypothetical protein